MAPTTYDTDQVVTIPNVLSFARLVGVPLFGWLVVTRADVAAVVVLAVAGCTDWLDGYLARRWHQISRVGQMLDPVADRLYIVVILLALAWRELIPWWLVVLLVARDLMLLALVPALKTRGYTSLPVHYVGKIGTFCLLYAFPLVLLGAGDASWQHLARIVGWAFAIWGTAVYWWAGLGYVWQTVTLVRDHPAAGTA